MYTIITVLIGQDIYGYLRLFAVIYGYLRLFVRSRDGVAEVIIPAIGYSHFKNKSIINNIIERETNI